MGLDAALATRATIAAAALLAGCAPLPRVITHGDIAAWTPAHFAAPVASAAGAAAEREKALATIRAAEADGADDETTLAALWAVAFFDIEPEAGRGLLRRELSDAARPLAQRPVEHQRALIAAAHVIDPALAAPLLAPQLAALATPREFAATAHTLLQAGADHAIRERIRRALAERADRDEDPRLEALRERLDRADGSAASPPRPPLADLFAGSWRNGFPVVYSLQRRDRRHAGLVLVRSADGRFVRESDGRFFARAHLALATTQLPGTITNGNTPQGLFTIAGAGFARNVWIGPTPYLWSKVPFEASVAEFFHSAAEQPWSRELYDALLPPTWRGYRPMHEAWLAGRAGRTEMLAHGTTIDAEAYRARPWYPLTPSAGCLVAGEHWAADDGRMVASDQLALVKAFTRDGFDRGYLVVVEIDDAARPVALEEVLAEVRAGEAR